MSTSIQPYDSNQLKTLLSNGEIEKAKAFCENALQTYNNNDVVWNDCGLVYAKAKDMPKALDYFEKAIALNPNQTSYYNNLSNVCVALGQIDKGLQYLHQSLRLDPNHAESYNNLGRLYYLQGLNDKAAFYLEKALRLNPNYWEAHYNLAHTLTKQNQLERAAQHYKEVVRIVPDHPNALLNLGLALTELGQDEESALYLKRALELAPDNIEAARRLGHIHLNLGNVQESINAFSQVIALDPEHSEAHHNLGVLFLRNQDYQNALKHFKMAQDNDPNDETAQHMVFALSGQTTPKAPRSYIVSLYDQYADYFNEHLKELNYVAPSLLRNAVAQCFDTLPRAGRVLDMGCGTGLCAVYFRDLALQLVGVDISPKMIEKAEALQAYDELIISPIEEFLNQPNLDPFDLIYSTDVLCYFGELDDIFKGVANALKPNGRYAFTLEKLDKGTYFLEPNGRYCHSMEYLRNLAKTYGFLIEREESIIPRNEVTTPVSGLLYVMKKEAPIPL